MVGAARDGQHSLLSTPWSSKEPRLFWAVLDYSGPLRKCWERRGEGECSVPAPAHSLSRAEGQWGTLEQEEEEVHPMNNFPCCSWESQEGSKAGVLGGGSMSYMLRWEIRDHVGAA